MRKRTHKRVWMSVVLLGLLVLASGCIPATWLLAPLSFGVGHLTAAVQPSTSVEYICYRDGVLVDCSTLSDFVE